MTNPFAQGAAPDVNPFAVPSAPQPAPQPRRQSSGVMERYAETKTRDALSSRPIRRGGTAGILEEWIEITVLYGALGTVVTASFVMSVSGSVAGFWAELRESRIAQWLNLDAQVDAESVTGASMAFEGFEIATPYLLDDSPSGSYDFTLLDQSGSDKVKVPSPCQGKVTEAGSRGGYGNAIAILCDDGIELFMAHFSQLYLGAGDNVAKGQLFAMQGSTGNSTGPHIHLEVTKPGHVMSDRSVTRPYVENVLLPFWRNGASGSDFSADVYKQWIATQESGSNYSAVNPDSGALGKYQFMPATMRSTAAACSGVNGVPSSSQFLSSPDLQEAIMGCYVDRAWDTIQRKTDDPMVQCRMMASYHYSGNPDWYDDPDPQYTNGREYPSIASYTESVCQEMM